MVAVQQDIHRSNCKVVKFDNIYKQLKLSLKKCVDTYICIACEKGSSSWLPALPIQKYAYALHKQAFIDAICFHYG